jgi:histidinol-phosphate aminotransferase
MGATAAAVAMAWRGGVADTAEAAVRAVLPLSPQILLNSNENPYGPSERVLASMREAAAMANRYPDDQVGELTAHIAEFHKIKPEQVVRGNGSGEVLRMAAEAFTGPGKKMVAAFPTFELLGAYSRRCGGELVQVPLKSDFSHDLEAMLARVDGTTGLVYICNPNNPTASLTPRSDIEAFLRKLPAGVCVIVDEAYHHFADSPQYTSFLDKLVGDERLIVLRTFSKVYGLAGIRLGYGVAAPDVIRKLARFQLADNNNMVAACCGSVALDDAAGVSAAVKRTAADRAEFMKQAAARGLKPIPSQANFVMMESGRPVRGVIDHFRQNHVLIGRPFPPLLTHVRVSLGTPDEMKEFWRVWNTLPALQTH